jgi:hypothetical protein
MITQPPTQPPPTLVPAPRPEPAIESQEPETIQRAGRKKRLGERPAALFVKSLLRPPIKGLYYLIAVIKTHKLLTLGALILLIASISLTTLFTTRSLPFGIGRDPWNLNINGPHADAHGEVIKGWLYDLRTGQSASLSLRDRYISQPPDVSQLIQTFSEARTNLTWKSVNVIGSIQESDTTVDTVVQIQFETNGPSGATTAVLVLHFVTAVSSSGQAVLMDVNVVSTRAMQS